METIITSGSNATSSSGTVNYSIGQLFYMYVGETVYNVAQGVQHPKIPNIKNNSIDTKKEIVVLNDPKTDYVTLNMKGFELEYGQHSYQIYDLQGRILKDNIINSSETQINLNDFIRSIYLLRVYDNNKVLKTFKIIKQ
ncbi:T9SS type A sorting domain-containing protein [Flavobacterium sp.]|uniref:T9SS type A sorting domain-containing protein n=1 Tax=Flavobacterium sp. TaxID=239 RepID=UPI002CCFC29D|nr:T9SS type A sorting domain-containing protein [Flavobacterium sp.]HSD08157.1 T9SS type A sorting domain-containing protein [Flavobacterium sp.]